MPSQKTFQSQIPEPKDLIDFLGFTPFQVNLPSHLRAFC
jgi:hypothetical protein